MSSQLRLSQFVQIIQKGVEMMFAEHEFLIIAEVNKIKEWHTRYYIELVEYEGNKVIATSHGLITNPAVLFGPLRERKLKLQELVGQQILITCKVDFHKDYGYQLHINQISAEYTLGSIKKKEANIKEQLQELWIYNLNKQKTLWLPPYRIAIISSPSSEGLKDFLDVLEHSDYHYSYELFETAIHGNTANGEIYKTLQKIYKLLPVASLQPSAASNGYKADSWEPVAGSQFDLVVIVRWGGGSSGVMWHNDLNIAKGICHMPIPVMMAVWHTSDQYLLDEIACFSAKTPTDAAYIIVSRYDSLKAQIDSLYEDMCRCKDERLKIYLEAIEKSKLEIENSVVQRLDLYKHSIQSWYDIIASSKPEKMLQSGYALLYDEQDTLLNKSAIDNLQKWDLMQVRVYDKILNVQIESL